MSAGHAWFVRRGSVERGPFPAALLKRSLLLGRLLPDDEISQDRSQWIKVAEHPIFSADGAGAAADPLQIAREDERSGIERRAGARADQVTGEPHTTERRKPESADETARRLRRAERQALPQPPLPDHRRVLAGSVLAVLCIFGSGWMLSDRGANAEVPQCGSGPAPGVDWRGCHLEAAVLANADLSGARLDNARLAEARLSSARLSDARLAYADLSLANLTLVDFTGADLRGADLRRADLRRAALQGADLSYADLRGARLSGANLNAARFDGALWVDGRSCARPSVGQCR